MYIERAKEHYKASRYLSEVSYNMSAYHLYMSCRDMLTQTLNDRGIVISVEDTLVELYGKIGDSTLIDFLEFIDMFNPRVGIEVNKIGKKKSKPSIDLLDKITITLMKELGYDLNFNNNPVKIETKSIV